jgi:hypothetical protein
MVPIKLKILYQEIIFAFILILTRLIKNIVFFKFIVKALNKTYENILNDYKRIFLM